MTQDTTSVQPGLRVSAMRGKQGGRTVYFTALPIREFAEQIPVLTDIPKGELKEQRIFDPAHASDIAKYVLGVDGYVVPPLIVTLDRDPEWQPVGEADGSAFGSIHISPETRRRITDGMHRGDGLVQANAADPDERVVGDHIGLWIVVEPDISKRKMMFADVNRSQKAVPKSLSIAFDFRDPYAEALRRLAAEHPLLKDVVEEERSRATKGSGKLFTIAALRSALEAFAGSGLTEPQGIYLQGKLLFGIIVEARPELANLGQDPVAIDELRAKSIIASSTTLRVIAGALRQASRSIPLDRLGAALVNISFDPNDPLWLQSGFTTPGSSTPSSRNQEVRAATQALAEALVSASSKSEGA